MRHVKCTEFVAANSCSKKASCFAPQFSVTGDRGLLATAEAGVQRILQHAAEPPPKELWDTPIPPDEANFGIEVTCVFP